MALPLPEGTEQTPLTWAWLNRSIQAINWLLGLKVARDCGLTLTGTMAGPVIGYIAPKQALIAKTPAGGIPAMSGTTPGSATCRIWNRGATGALADSLVNVTVYNAGTTAVSGNTLIPVERADGVFFAPPPATVPATLVRVLSPAGGIAARSGGTPGSASCTLCTWNGTTWTSTGGSLTVKNDYPTAVGASKLLWVTLWGSDYFVVTEQC